MVWNDMSGDGEEESPNSWTQIPEEEEIASEH